MPNRPISQDTALTTPASDDLLPVVDVSEAAAADKNKSVTFSVLETYFNTNLNFVTKVGTPVNNQLAVWTGDGTLEGESGLLYDSTSGNLVLNTSQVLIGHTSTGSTRPFIISDAGGATYTIDPDTVGTENYLLNYNESGAAWITQKIGASDYLWNIATGAEYMSLDASGNLEASGNISASNLSGTNTGDQTSIVGITGTKAQFDTAVTDGDFMYVGDAPTAHNHDADYISIVTTPTVGNFPQLTAGGELVNSTYDETSFDAAGTASSAVSTHESTYNHASYDTHIALTNEHIDWTSATQNLSTSGTVTGSNLSGTNTGDEVSATDAVEGVVELATQAEVDAGTDTSRVVTPATLASYSGLSTSYWTQNGTDLYYTAGDVGIGTTSPAYRLTVAHPDVAGSAGAVITSSVSAWTVGPTNGSQFTVGNEGGGSIQMWTGGVTGNCSIIFGDNVNGASDGRIRYEGANRAMTFNTASSERIRIDSAGNVGIGTTSPDGLLHVAGELKAPEWTDISNKIHHLHASGNFASYLINGEWWEVLKILPTGSSANYYIEGEIVIGTGSAYNTYSFSLKIRTNTLPSLSLDLTYSVKNKQNNLNAIELVTWSETTTNGEVRVAVKNTGNTVHNAQAYIRGFYRGDYRSTVTADVTAEVTSVPAGLTETAGTFVDYVDWDQFTTSSTSLDVPLAIVNTNDSGGAELQVRGDGQGDGYVFVGQGSTYGGGMAYRGDTTSPKAMTNAGSDRVTFFGRNNDTDVAVFDYSFNPANVLFHYPIYVDNVIRTRGNTAANAHQFYSADGASNYCDIYANLSNTVNYGLTFRKQGVTRHTLAAGSDEFDWFNSSGTQIMELTNGGNLTVEDGTLTVNSSTTATLTVNTTAANSYDAQIIISGSRTAASTANIAAINFQNIDNTRARITMRDPAGSSAANDGSLVFATCDNGTLTDQMTLDEAGNLLVSGQIGIDQTAPTELLEVGDHTVVDDKFIQIRKHFNQTSGLRIGHSTLVDAEISVNSTEDLQIKYDNRDTPLGRSLQFIGGGSERMRITNAGDVGIGDTTPSYKLDVSGTIRATGDVIAYSDIRVKRNLAPIESALDRLTELTGYIFERTDRDNKLTAGVIAQEVEKVLPEAVYEDDKGMKSVSPHQLQGLIVQAIKELAEKVERLH